MSVATLITQGFGTFGTVALVVTDGYSISGEVPPTPPAPPEPTATVSGVKSRPFRVRRSDFSSQANYEFALRAALLESNFGIAENPPEPVVVERKKRRVSVPKSLPVDKSLSGVLDGEISTSAANFTKLQRAADMEEMELLQLFITIIEDDWA